MLENATVEQLAGCLRGRVVTPGDADYDEARKVWNGMIDRKPSMIAQCSGTADVITCVNFAREHDLPVSVKGGGHGVAGKSICDDGLMIDLSRMNAVLVDSELKTAQVQGGATIGDMDHETQAFGLATTGGTDSRTGVAGLTLGGGIGHVARSFGLAADNLLAADVVTADGALVHTSETENPDLLWALRGGGGNFGVVTNFEFQLHVLGPEVLSAQIFHPFEDAGEVFRFYRDFMANAPDEVACYLVGLRVPPAQPFPEESHGKITILLLASYSGDIEEGKRFLKPVEEFGNPILKVFMPMPYTVLQSSLDAGLPDGARYYWKSHYLQGLSDAAIDTIVDRSEALPGEFSAVGIEPHGGAIDRVDAEAAAYPHRHVAFNLLIAVGWGDPDSDDEIISWAGGFHDAMAPYSTGGMYVNYLADGPSDDRSRAAYGPNYERLRQIKTKYDPDNLFNAHHGIKSLEDLEREATPAKT